MSKLFDSIDILVFVVVLGAAGYLLGTNAGLGLEEKDEVVERSEMARVAVNKALNESKYEGDDGHAILTRLMELPDEIEEQWSPEIKSRPYQTGVFYHAAAVQDLRDEKDLELRFLPPSNVTATSDIGVIQVTWEASDRSTVDVN